MEKYWLILEPYVFIKVTSVSAIAYNTLNYKYYETDNEDVVAIFNALNDDDNCYVVSITTETIKNSNVNAFITWLKSSFSGDCISNKITHSKPFQVIPCLYLKKNKQNIDNYGINGNNINQSIRELVLYVNTFCEQDCKLCNEGYKQTTFCKKGTYYSELNSIFIQNILSELSYTSLKEVSIVGGNIFEYSEIDYLLQILRSSLYKVTFYVHIKNISNIACISHLSMDNATVAIIVVVNEMNEKQIAIIRQIIEDRKKIYINYIIQNETEYVFILNNSLYSKKCNIIPYYNKNNMIFFKNNVFVDKSDIVSSKRKMSDILKGRILNSHFWGKLIIDVDKNVYSSFNLPTIGILSNSNFSFVLFNATKEKSAWKLIREQNKPCDSCLYNFLCPAISDYELIIGKPNLCHTLNPQKNLW
jgi:pseudo-rSAM protein